MWENIPNRYFTCIYASVLFCDARCIYFYGVVLVIIWGIFFTHIGTCNLHTTCPLRILFKIYFQVKCSVNHISEIRKRAANLIFKIILDKNKLIT